MLQPKKIITTTIVKKRVEIGAADLKLLLIDSGIISKEFSGSLEIFVDVPAGGDYSGQRLHIDRSLPVIVCIEEIKSN